jgi:hypothetical protein
LQSLSYALSNDCLPVTDIEKPDESSPSRSARVSFPSFVLSMTNFLKWSMYDDATSSTIKLTDIVSTGPKAVGGHIISHASATIVALRKGRGEERVAKLIDSPGETPSLSHCYETKVDRCT